MVARNIIVLVNKLDGSTTMTIRHLLVLPCIFVLVLVGESIKVTQLIKLKVGPNQPGCWVSGESGLQGWWRWKEGTTSNEG